MPLRYARNQRFSLSSSTHPKQRSSFVRPCQRDWLRRLSRAYQRQNTSLWTFPNRGMTGGEIRTIGAAATPTFTAFRGPDAETYEASALQHKENVSQIFGANDPAPHIENIFAAMLPHGEVGPPAFSQKARWLPFNLRALDPGQQIYSHHGNHYGLSIYDALPEQIRSHPFAKLVHHLAGARIRRRTCHLWFMGQ